MNANRPNKETSLLREQQVWDLRIRCYSQQQIAQQLGISQSAVSQILDRVRDRLAKQYLEGALQMRIDQTEQLLKIAQEAYADYEASKQEAQPPFTPTPEEETPPPQPPAQPSATPFPVSAANAVGVFSAAPRSGSSGRAGGSGGLGGKPTYLRLMLQALAAIRAIWGLEAAEKARIQAPQQGIKMLIGIDYDSLKNQNGVAVSRKEAERALGRKLV